MNIRLALAILFLTFAMLPAAHARTQCKPAGMEYIHAFEQRPNWGVYWWCDYKTYDYTVIIPEDSTGRTGPTTSARSPLRQQATSQAPCSPR
jgi:hypothetical protein